MKPQIIIISIIISIILLFSCKKEVKNDMTELKKEIEVNPEYENSPPIATEISLEVLNKPLATHENIKLFAKFEKGEIRGQYLAIYLNDEKFILRDDGKGADKLADDQIFSIFLKEDLENLKSELKVRQKLALDRDTIPKFINRRLLRIDVGNLEKFIVPELDPGIIIKLPFDILEGIKRLTDLKKSLMITNTLVVEDIDRTFNPCTGRGNPTGVWTFGELMRQMASPSPASMASDEEVSDFALNWLNTWTTNQIVNGDNLDSRNIQSTIITPWLNASVAAGAPVGQLSMQLAPFKLIAVVNRLDLRGNSGYGFSNAGEGRFVFNAINSSCNSLQFTVIFEYGINKKSCSAVKDFAQQWSDLSPLPLGSSTYNANLEAITEQFTQSGTNTSKPNQNSINQIRTNEIALGNPWELREFKLNAAGQLELTTVKQEPALKYNRQLNTIDVERLARYINNLAADIENNNYQVPDEIPEGTSRTPTTAFLGGKAHVPDNPIAPPNEHIWNGTIPPGPGYVVSDEARHIFSLNTCSACHGGETQTQFTHIKPTPFGIEATLSGFLTGITLDDPASRPSGRPTVRTFNDLLRRENDLDALLTNSCLKSHFLMLARNLIFDPIKMTH